MSPTHSPTSPLQASAWAHSPSKQGEPHGLRSHLEAVAEQAARFARPFDGAEAARFLGWLHDIGKAESSWQEYIRTASGGRSGPDHSSVGALMAARRRARIFALSLAGHHGGLFNRTDLGRRLERARQDSRLRTAAAAAEDVFRSWGERMPDPPSLPGWIVDPSVERTTALRQMEFWLRMLHSALVDADLLDTEAHFRPDDAAGRRSVSAGDLWPRVRSKQEQLIARARGPVNALRARVYRCCVTAADEDQGIFSLTVPTGGGKTRSGLSFALRHAEVHELERVVVALPYTSIIDQNAEVYRDLVGAEHVLEHHSAVQEDGASLDHRLAAENWGLPVVATTTVQLLESLFSNRNRQVRRLHNLANSVLVLDEVQTLPPELLEPTLEVLQDLVAHYGVTLVLSTATPPALVEREGFSGLEQVREIVPGPDALFEQLRRVRYEVMIEDAWSSARVWREMQTSEQSLCVVNTVADARALLEEAGDRDDVFHLSTRLCGAHRKSVLGEVRRRLSRGEPVHLVSTQVVEAGVDIDFPLVLRALGPLDRIVQAAGRCNREGRLREGRVVIFRSETGGMPSGAYRTGRDEARKLLLRDDAPDLHDPRTLRRYFRRLYDSRNLDEREVQDAREDLAYEDVADRYRLIDDDSVSVIVRPGRDVPVDVSAPGRMDPGGVLEGIRVCGCATREERRALQPWIVSLPRCRLERVERHVEEVVEGLYVWRGEYGPRQGLRDDVA